MRVLLVEDNAVTRTALADLLHAQGHQVCGADSAEAAEKLVGPFRPDVALIDHYLPGLDGAHFLARLRMREETKALPAVLQTAAGDAEARRLEKIVGRCGEARLMRKPCPPEDVIAALKEMAPKAR